MQEVIKCEKEPLRKIFTKNLSTMAHETFSLFHPKILLHLLKFKNIKENLTKQNIQY